MLAWLTDPFQDSFTQRALVEVLVLSLACGPLGVWILLYRQSYAAESISHGMLPGLVLAALAGAPLVLGAGVGVLLAAAAISLAGRDERLGGDTGVAVAVSALFGLGALLALSPEAPPRLQELLFGDLLGASRGDIAGRGRAGGADRRVAGVRAPAAEHERVRPLRGALARAPSRRAGSSRCWCCSPSRRWPPRPRSGACCWWR